MRHILSKFYSYLETTESNSFDEFVNKGFNSMNLNDKLIDIETNLNIRINNFREMFRNKIKNPDSYLIPDTIQQYSPEYILLNESMNNFMTHSNDMRETQTYRVNHGNKSIGTFIENIYKYDESQYIEEIDMAIFSLLFEINFVIFIKEGDKNKLQMPILYDNENIKISNLN